MKMVRAPLALQLLACVRYTLMEGDLMGHCLRYTLMEGDLMGHCLRYALMEGDLTGHCLMMARKIMILLAKSKTELIMENNLSVV